jgi:hypothetical protein
LLTSFFEQQADPVDDLGGPGYLPNGK